MTVVIVRIEVTAEYFLVDLRIELGERGSKEVFPLSALMSYMKHSRL